MAQPSSEIRLEHTLFWKLEDEPVTGGLESPCVVCAHLLTPHVGLRGRHRYDGVVCRVCGDTWHSACLAARGQLSSQACAAVAMQSDDMEKRWSCPQCDDISKLLSEEELAKIMEDFEKHDKDKDNALSDQEFFHYRSDCFGLRHPASSETADVEMVLFQRLKDQGSTMSWNAFLAHEFVEVMRKRPKAELVVLLSPLERNRMQARKEFRNFDIDEDSVISSSEARRVYENWFVTLGNSKESARSETVQSKFLTLQVHLYVEMFMKNGGPDGVTFPDYVSAQALNILSNRINVVPKALSPLPPSGAAAGQAAQTASSPGSPTSQQRSRANTLPPGTPTPQLNPPSAPSPSPSRSPAVSPLPGRRHGPTNPTPCTDSPSTLRVKRDSPVNRLQAASSSPQLQQKAVARPVPTKRS